MTEFVLTHEQETIVAADCDGPRLVDAGAGTGKTFTMVQRARALIGAGMPPDALLVVTFTKAAASEIAGRLDAVLDPRERRRPVCGTFHGIAYDLLREFAYESGISPDLRVVDDGRARGIFARAFRDLEAGRLDVDLQSFPLLDRPKALERSLAAIALTLKGRGIDVDRFRADALAQADALAALPFGGIKSIGKRGGVLKGWPKPDPERSPQERRLEAEHERRNVAVVAALFARFQALLDEAQLLTFGDAIVRATAMVRDRPAIAQRLRARWRHAIVDEFQDTNGTQIAFLEAIFGPELRQVLVVGDVRQAIYEFNGAEPQGIIDFRARARETLPLGENRRSLQPILDVAHHALAELAGNRYPGDGKALRAQRGRADLRVVRASWFTGEDAREQEAAAVADAVRRLIEIDGTPPSDIALLMRGRTRAPLYAAALHERGIATQLRGGVGFFAAPEIREVTAWARLAVDPTDAYALVGTLQSAAINLGDGALVALAQDGDLARAALLDPAPAAFDDTERARLARFRATARLVSELGHQPLVDAVRTIVALAGAEAARLERPESAAQARANLDQFVRLANDLANDVPAARLRDLIAELDEREALDLDLPLAELEGDRVSLVTVHGAKGLEWKHVFVVDVAPSAFPLRNNDAREVVARLDAHGALALKHGVDGRPTLRWYCTSFAHDENGILVAQPPDDSEEFRLFYVALTRARDSVTVTGRTDRYGNRSTCIEAVADWIERKGHGAAAHGLAVPAGEDNGLAAAAAEPLDDQMRRLLQARVERLVRPETTVPLRTGTLSYTAIEAQERCPRRARYQYVLGLPNLEDDAPAPGLEGADPDREIRHPARYGRIVHRVLELDALARIERSERELSRFVAEAVEQEEGTEAEATAAERAARAALAILEPYEPVDAERRFALEIDGVALGGYIDLLARDATGRLVVIDYKTGQTPSAHYALQFALYAKAVADAFAEVPRTVLLRITSDGADAEEVEPATDSALHAAIAPAQTMESDEPRPGPGCRLCPYAHDVCAEAGPPP